MLGNGPNFYPGLEPAQTSTFQIFVSSLCNYFSLSEKEDFLYQVMLCWLTRQRLHNISGRSGCVLQTVPMLWGMTQRRVSKQGGQYHSDRYRRSSMVGGSCKCVRWLNTFVFCKGIEKCKKLGTLLFKRPKLRSQPVAVCVCFQISLQSTQIQAVIQALKPRAIWGVPGHPTVPLHFLCHTYEAHVGVWGTLGHVKKLQTPRLVTWTELQKTAGTIHGPCNGGLRLELRLPGLCCAAQGIDGNHNTELLSSCPNS